MIANTSLSAFSAADLRPVRSPPPPSERPPVDATQGIQQVRGQSDTPATQKLLAPGSTSGAPPDRPMPRGSLLDLSV